MEEFYTRSLWIIMGMMGSLIVGVLSFIIRNSITRNATKESVSAKTDLLEKDIEHLIKQQSANQQTFTVLHKRVSDLRDSSKEIYVSKEVFHQTIKQFNEKLDTILTFVKR